MLRVRKLIDEHQRVIESLVPLIPSIEIVSREMVSCLRSGGKIILMGNGGSAADAQHLAAEFVGKFQQNRQPFAAIALTTDTSILTAVANDYGFEEVFVRQIEGLYNPGDMAVGISTSGSSPNVIKAIEYVANKGGITVGFSGREGGGRLQDITSYCLTVPSQVTARIQEAHILMGHILCELVEDNLAGGGNDI